LHQLLHQTFQKQRDTLNDFSLSKLSGFNKVSTVPAGVLQMQRYSVQNSKGPSPLNVSTKFAASASNKS
jgi:hypothetical protein